MHPSTFLERALRRERAVFVTVLVAVTLACWAWIVPMARDMYGPMSGPSAWMMTAEWDARHLSRLCAMWIVMMAGMMLPSAAPLLLLYARGGFHVYAMAAGYLLVWIAFSVFATALQRALSTLLLLSPMMEATRPQVSGGLLILAGLYQLTPLKRACLGSCASPQTFLMLHWRDGRSGGFRMGVAHGLFCAGCCWALMLLLFAGGVMNLTVIGAITALVLVEKLLPFGQRSLPVTGAILIAGGLWLLTGNW